MSKNWLKSFSWRKLWKQYWVFLVTLVLIGIDQLTKWIAQVNLYITPLDEIIAEYRFFRANGLNTDALYYPGKSISWIPYHLEFRLTYNDGAAWSMFSGETWFLVLVSVVSTIALIALVIYFKKDRWLQLMLAIILAGAAGNGIDRIVNEGLVIDFININFFAPFNRQFPIFNVADICVSIGGAALVIYVLFEDKRKGKKLIKDEANHE